MKRYAKRKTRRPFYKRRRTSRTFKVAKRAARSTIQRMAEKKYYDVSVNHAAEYASWTIYELSQFIAQGTTKKTRIGNKINMFKVFGHTTVTAGDGTNDIRLLIVKPKRQNSVISSQLPDLNAPVDTDSFTVLFDRHFYLNQENIYQKMVNWRIRPGKLQYADGIAQAGNGIFVCCRSDSTVTPNPFFAGYWRLYYTDI